MVVQVRDGQVVIRQGHCRHRAIPLANKIREERVKARLIKFVLTSFVART
jgi:phenylpropionate dioxygenase-like ring-hydroxylating dioxygenase large terminal subunit